MFSKNLRNVILTLLVNSIFITKSINLQLVTLILYGVGVRCDRRRFSGLSPFIEKSMVYIYLVINYLYIYIYIYIYSVACPPHYLVPSDALGSN